MSNNRPPEVKLDSAVQPKKNKKYTYQQLATLLDTSFKKYGITTAKSDILEHSLLRFAGIEEFPLFCHFGPHADPYLAMELSLSDASITAFTAYLNKVAPGAASIQPSKPDEPKELHLNISLIYQIVSSAKYQTFLRNMLKDNSILDNYRLACNGQSYSLDQIQQKIFASYNFRFKLDSSFLGIAILRAFGIQDVPAQTRYDVAKRYDTFAQEIDIFFGISIGQSLLLIDNINNNFKDAAKSITFSDDLQQVAIKISVLMSAEFQLAVWRGIQLVQDNEKSLFKTWRQKNPGLLSTVDIWQALTNLAKKYQEKSAALSGDLERYADQVYSGNPAVKSQEGQLTLRQAYWKYQADAKTAEEVKAFKEDKKRIKELMDAATEPASTYIITRKPR